jgi:hypothetical protein
MKIGFSIVKKDARRAKKIPFVFANAEENEEERKKLVL